MPVLSGETNGKITFIMKTISINVINKRSMVQKLDVPQIRHVQNTIHNNNTLLTVSIIIKFVNGKGLT